MNVPAAKLNVTVSEPNDSPIANRRIAFVGKLGGMNRREARELVRRHGATMVDRVDLTVELIVIGADALPLGDATAEQSDLLDDWVIEASLKGQMRVINETQFWQELGLVEPELDIGHLYTPAMLAGLLDLPISTIRRWHRRGLITPTRQVNKLAYFDFQEVASARRIARLVASGATPQSIENKLSQLAGLYPNLLRPLSQLSVIVEGQNVLLRQGAGLIEPGGQMRIDFDSLNAEESDSENAQLISIESSPVATSSVEMESVVTSLEQLATPDEFIRLAIDFEDADDPQAAIEVYRAMSLAFGPSADASFRIAELLYQQHDLNGARERYYVAVELDESFVEARASLGCVLVELDQPQLALSAFHGALRHHADYPDVHFHLAHLLDDLDQRMEAESHWRKFLDLAPKSPWAEEARHRLEIDD
ncbi:MAG: tetratricopeptide (TPR) repeat protein [Mariniblastus sp.]|jgi:tetratricopeptide (TPR) repeat protein